jgi:arylsulfatase A-like enzyme
MRQRRTGTRHLSVGGILMRGGLGLALLLALLAAPNPIVPHGQARAQTGPPTIVLLITDDQRWDATWAMPNVQNDLVAHGITFNDAFVVNALCCPSRTTILTGKYSHSTGVYTNSWPYGGFRKFNDSSTLATWLHTAGYQTALIGKYLNQYTGLRIPPGWDHWFAFTGKGTGAAYYYYDINEDGVSVHYGGTPADYSTDVLANEAERYILSADPSSPMFLMFTPYAPHDPAKPAPQYVGAFSWLEPYRPPNFNEADVSDKPQWVQMLPLMDENAQASNDLFRENEYETLLSADDAIGRVMNALETTGRLSNSLIVFMSDNGFAWGEHRFTNKKQPYEEGIRVPMVIRDDALISSPSTDDHFVLNVDLAPTIAEAAGVSAPGAEGTSLMPLITGTPPPTWRTDFLIEHRLGDDDIVPTYCAVRNATNIYVQYVTGEEELYDLVADPYELTNVASDPAYQSVITPMRSRLMELCRPLPPGLAATSITVGDTGFSKRTATVAQGRVVGWNVAGSLQHTITDTTGMGLFDSGPLSPGAPYSATYLGAGSYPYADSLHPTMTGTIKVPLVISPTSGTIGTAFTVTWAAAAASTGYGFDVQIRRPGSSAWTNWQLGQVVRSGAFVPDVGPGTYSFRARMRSTLTGSTSGWSAVASISVS